MDTDLASSSIHSLIASFKEILTDNFGIVLAFSAGILVWFILKKWVFGASHRV